MWPESGNHNKSYLRKCGLCDAFAEVMYAHAYDNICKLSVGVEWYIISATTLRHVLQVGINIQLR